MSASLTPPSEALALPDVRCFCNRLLFRGTAKLLEIKCPNCKRLWLITDRERSEYRPSLHSPEDCARSGH